MMKNSINIVAIITILILCSPILAYESNVALDSAARKGDVITLKRLLEKGNKADQPNMFGYVALTGAAGKCTRSHLKAIQLLLQYGSNINRQAPDGTTALNNASYWGCKENVQFLINAGADVNLKKTNGYTPLMSASSRGFNSLVKILVKAGADLNNKTQNDVTALHMASSNGHTDTVIMLLKYGADPGVQTIKGENFLEMYKRTQDIDTLINSTQKKYYK